MKDESLQGNELLEQDIKDFLANPCDELLAAMLTTIRKRMKAGGHFVVAIDAAKGVGESFGVRTATMDGARWMVAYTSFEEELKRRESVMSGFTAPISQILEMILKSDELAGVIINPWGQTIKIDKQLSAIIMNA